MTNVLSVKRFLLCAREKYQFVKTLLEESKNDPISEPYKSKYRAKEILQRTENDLSQLKLNDEKEIYLASVIISLLNYEIGVIFVETEEPSEGEKCMHKALDSISDNYLEPECINLYINILNQLGVLWSNRNDSSKACEFLKKAEHSYNEYKAKENPCPIEFENLFLHSDLRPLKNDWIFFEKSFTLTVYYLAQVYEHLDDSHSSAKYCHITLKRQLDINDYDPLEWSLNCATLSQYFIVKENFNIARHVLACANYMICKHEEQLKEQNESDEDKWEQLKRKKADISRCQAKYALQLFATSIDKQSEKKDENIRTNENNDDLLNTYRLFDEDKVGTFENEIICTVFSNFDEARKVFLYGVNKLKSAHLFYIIDNYTYDHVEIAQDHSKFYKYLICFEEDNQRKCKMHKRRINMLEAVLEKLNMHFYLALCRQLIFELGEIYSEMINLKYLVYNESDLIPCCDPNRRSTKLNLLVNKSVQYYLLFIDSFRDNNKKFPDIFADDVVRPALIAHFYLGRLFSKFIPESKEEEVNNLKKGQEYYEFVTNYIEKNPSHESFIEKELPLIKEMLELLPIKIHNIRSRIEL